ncbi:hypothetical protein OHA98_13415 [Streptomyces sp. NBC_00654]|nr:hypothetical protein [Streptomyces sp. NBC_00654]
MELVEVHDEAQAAERGMNGSPTVLLDGVDPFAPAGAVPSVSCRLYREGTAPWREPRAWRHSARPSTAAPARRLPRPDDRRTATEAGG